MRDGRRNADWITTIRYPTRDIREPLNACPSHCCVDSRCVGFARLRTIGVCGWRLKRHADNGRDGGVFRFFMATRPVTLTPFHRARPTQRRCWRSGMISRGMRLKLVTARACVPTCFIFRHGQTAYNGDNNNWTVFFYSVSTCRRFSFRIAIAVDCWFREF